MESTVNQDSSLVIHHDVSLSDHDIDFRDIEDTIISEKRNVSNINNSFSLYEVVD